jgi:trehalose 6-phosphate synthase
LFAQLPRRTEVLQGLLGADVVGFQTRTGAQNFCRLCRRFANAKGRGTDLQFEHRRIRAREFPISIDFNRFESLARSPSVIELAEQFRTRLHGVERIILGVDRMDYTKGIELRLRAFQELLRSKRVDPARCVFVQVGVPSRERVGTYRDIRAEIEEVIGQINGEFGELGLTPVHYLYRSLPIEELISLYCAADVMMVTPLRDGMNLVAKEYVATRVNNDGVLLLSEFTGSARSLRSAVLVNPHDDVGLQAALEKCLHLSTGEKRQRMKALRRVVSRHDVYQWAQEFIEALRA